MALQRLQGLVHRFYLAAPNHFEDWQNPTLDELNANPTNDPSGTIFNITCALNTDGTTFDLGDPETDDSTTFCQVAGSQSTTAYNPEIVFEAERSATRWFTNQPGTLNSANLTFSLLAWRGVEYWAIMSIGRGPDDEFVEGDRVKMARITTDHAVDVSGAGENLRLQQTPAALGDINWNFRLTA